MTDEFRQKLLNWFCSIGLVLLATILPVAHYWLATVPQIGAVVHSPLQFSSVAGPLGESFFYYIITGPPVILWHIADFIERRQPETSVLKRATQYRLFFAALGIGILFFILIFLKLWEYNSCDQLPAGFFYQCITRPSFVIFIPWMVSIGLALLLCIVKAVWSIWSLLKKPE